MAALARELVELDPYGSKRYDRREMPDPVRWNAGATVTTSCAWSTRTVIRHETVPSGQFKSGEEPNDLGASMFVQLKDSVGTALDLVMNNGPLSPDDDRATRKAKLDALFSLRDAKIAEGMETWSEERVSAEMAKMRRREP